MKPITLKIKGLNSFAAEQSISFDKLTEVGLFGIFGKTGSGKSTVVDAVTMSLYGEMARYEKSKGRQFINTGAESAAVSLEFAIGQDVYVAERSFKRDKEGKPKTVAARLYKKANGETTVIADKERAVTEHVTAITGLSYDDFSRSVVLPQGKFSEFLLLENVERRNMLERIFRLERFGEDLNARIRAAHEQAKTELLRLEETLKLYEGITPEAVSSKKLELAEEANHLTELKKTQAEILEKKNRLDEFERLNKQLSLYCDEQKKLLEKEEHIKTLQQKVLESQKASMVKPFYDKALESNNAFLQTDKLLNDKQAQYSKLVKEAEEAKDLYAEKLAEKEKLSPDLTKKVFELEAVMETQKSLVEMVNVRKQLIKEYTALKQKAEQSQMEIVALVGEKVQLENKLSEIEERKAVVTTSADYRQKLNEASGVLKAVVEKTAKTFDIEQSLKKLAEQQNEVTQALEKNKETLFALKTEATNTEQKITEISESLKQASQQLITLKTEVATLEASYKLRKSLVPFEPCPVCGSTEHDSAHLNGGLDDYSEQASKINEKLLETEIVIKTAETEKNKFEKLLKATTDKKSRAEIEEGKLNERASFLHEQTLKASADFEAEKKQLEALSESLALHKKQLATDDIQKAVEQSAKNDREAEALSHEERKTRVSLLEAGKQLDQKKQAVEATKLKMQEIVTQGEGKKEAIAEMEAKVFEKTGGKEPAEFLNEVKAKLTEIETAVSSAKLQLEKLEEKAKAEGETVHKLTATVEERKTAFESRSQELAEALTKHGYETAEQALAFVLPSETVAKLQAEVEAHVFAMQKSGANIERLKQQVFTFTQEHSALLNEEVTLAQLAERLTEVSATIEEKTGKAAVLEREVLEMEQKLTDIVEFGKKRDIWGNKAELLNDIATLFKGNRFVEFVAERHLKYIAAEASSRLKEMTSGRYALVLDGTSFAIRDDKNGGEMRSPKTLSGGEVFMASLCLALSLSSKIQLSNNAPLEFFFLDEGFGTLDEVRLDVVLQSLEKLIREKMTIGLISHVEALKERVAVKLIVKEAADSGEGTTVSIEYS